ncbi:MAG: hypothetical protein ACRDO8_07235 [Nocardioidaceae bacterium]
MEILIWLAVPLAVTALAMAWALWAGRSRRISGEGRDRPAKRAAAYDRFSAAVQKPVPGRARTVTAQQRERPSGIAVRPSQRRPR